MGKEAERSIHQCECAICQAGNDPATAQYHQQVNLLLSRLNEPQRRWYVGVLSQQPDSPRDGQLSAMTGLDEKTIRRGRRALEAGLNDVPPGWRWSPATRKKDPQLEATLLKLVAPHTAGDPMSDQKWLNCRLPDIRTALEGQEQGVSAPVISRLRSANGYRLRANTKQQAGQQHPDRDQQFEYIREQRTAHPLQNQPILSVDSKKKALVGNFKNAGQIWCQTPERVKVHDFPSEALGRAVPYGLYDRQHHCGTVYVGQSADTPAFAVDHIAHWCRTELPERFPEATQLMIEADGGGSNGDRARVWKRDLQDKVADAFGLTVTVCHDPTGTAKWNPIEHRLFSEISKTWAGCPLRAFDHVLHYIRDTKTQTGLTVPAHLVTNTYETGVKVPDRAMDQLAIQRHDVCPNWNDTIYPRSSLPLT